jgi:peptidyl-prolyl cis-trans isomerase A (cyclophilin A)
MKKLLIFALLLVAPTAFAQEKPKLRPGTYAHFQTSMGKFTVELYERQAPKTVANFIGLVEGSKEWKHPKTGRIMKGQRYYDGVTFHRIIPGFMIQGGDPTGSGTGGPGYTIPDEIGKEFSFNKEGVLAMANTGRPNSGSAQFFVTVSPYPSLNGGYTIFGQVADGMNVVHAIALVKTTKPGDKPVTPVVIQKVTIQRVKSTGE